jgi:transcriptional regulator with XRE-family HTH domain
MLVSEARRLLRLNQRGLAELVGCSVRTVQRNSWTGGIGYSGHYATLIRAVHPQSPDLAARLAQATGHDLDALGLTTAPDLRPVAARREHADAIVAAAADVLDVSPKSVRPAIAAAFTLARELNVGLDTLAPLLAAAKPAAPAKR